MAFALAANKANVCFVGTPKELTFSVSEWENLNRKEFNLTGSWMSYSAPFPGREWELVAHYFQDRRAEVRRIFHLPESSAQQDCRSFEWYKTPDS